MTPTWYQVIGARRNPGHDDIRFALDGHYHPAVVEAVNKQMKLLNTHTRYLHETIVDYSEKILAKMPGEVAKVMFMCTRLGVADFTLCASGTHSRLLQSGRNGSGIYRLVL